MNQNTYHWKKQKRYNTPNHEREFTFSCYRKYSYFSDPIACEIFLDFLDNARKGKKRLKFWQPGGGYDRNLWNPKPIHSAIDYIENNPVRDELVSNSDDYRWSSAYKIKAWFLMI